MVVTSVALLLTLLIIVVLVVPQCGAKSEIQGSSCYWTSWSACGSCSISQRRQKVSEKVNSTNTSVTHGEEYCSGTAERYCWRNCTRPLVYWKANSALSKYGAHQRPWPQPSIKTGNEDDDYQSDTLSEKVKFPCPRAEALTWLKILRLPSKFPQEGSEREEAQLWNLLAQEYIVSILNRRSGARAPANVTRASREARVLLHCLENSTFFENSNSSRNAIKELYYVLHDWNRGKSGVSDCYAPCQAQAQALSSQADNVEASTDAVQAGFSLIGSSVGTKLSQISPTTLEISVSAVVLFIVIVIVILIVYRTRRNKRGSETSLSEHEFPQRQSRETKAFMDPLLISDSLPQPRSAKKSRPEEDEVDLQQQEQQYDNQTLQPETITMQLTEEDENLQF